MQILRRTALLAIGAAALTLGAPVSAADYPASTVNTIVPFGAGGGTDRWARVMSSGAFDVFGHGMHVQNRGGAGGTIGWKHMMDQKADGHSVLLASPTPVMAALIEKNPPYDPANVKIAAYYSVMKPTLVGPKGKPYSTWEGLVAYLKDEKNKKLTIGGTMTQLLGPASLLAQLGLEKRVILVPYSGTGKAVNDFLGGHISLVNVTTSTAVGLAQKNAIIVNASSLPYPKKALKELGDVPNATTIGLKPFNPPRFVAMHPDTPDAQVKAMGEKFGELLKNKSVAKLINKLNEDVLFMGAEEAQVAYEGVLVEAKKYLPLFQ
ncbi:MAG: Bug family tripartite tricarboxylate transporter substrate binding protein [Alphaproteobacteria bacterium]